MVDSVVVLTLVVEVLPVVVFISAMIVFIAFFICSFMRSLCWAVSLALNTARHSSLLLAIKSASGVFFQLNEARLILVAQAQRTNMMTVMELTPIQNHIFVAAVAGSRPTAVTWGFFSFVFSYFFVCS